MADNFTTVDKIKFESAIRPTEQSPKLKKSFVTENKIAMTICVTYSFLRELQSAKHDYPHFTFIDIVNTQLESFQFKQIHRLEDRFSCLLRKNEAKRKRCKGGRQIKNLEESSYTIPIRNEFVKQ